MINYTVVIPHYNSFKTIYKLINSIPKREDIEIVIVDDKSNDKEEVKKLDFYCKERNIVFLQNTTEKKGAGVCRNIALNRVNGRWLLFADADDYFLSGAFELMDKYCESEYDIIYFEPTSIDIKTGKKCDRHLYFKFLLDDYNKYKNEETYNNLKYHSVILWSRMIKFSVVKKNSVTFDETIVANDVNFSTKLAYYSNNIIALNDIIYCVTKSENTLTTKRDFHNLEIRIDVFSNQYKFLSERLSEKELKNLNFGGRGFIITAFKEYGILKCFKVIKIIHSYQIPIIGKNLFSVNKWRY